MQWSHVAVGAQVGTSSNTLFVTPRQDNYPPIIVKNQVFGQVAHQAAPAARGITGVADAPLPFLTTYTNSTTNSGRLVGAQFNDGGFGDIGLSEEVPPPIAGRCSSDWGGLPWAR
jgi:hypothetical protein